MRRLSWLARSYMVEAPVSGLRQRVHLVNLGHAVDKLHKRLNLLLMFEHGSWHQSSDDLSRADWTDNHVEQLFFVVRKLLNVHLLEMHVSPVWTQHSRRARKGQCPASLLRRTCLLRTPWLLPCRNLSLLDSAYSS